MKIQNIDSLTAGGREQISECKIQNIDSLTVEARVQISECKIQKQILDSCLQCKMCVMCTVAEWHAALPSRYIRFHKDGASTSLMKITFCEIFRRVVVHSSFEMGWWL